MQLTYRGSHYTVRHQAIKTVDTDLTGTFRGAEYPIKSAQGAYPKRAAQSLSYRRVKYFI